MGALIHRIREFDEMRGGRITVDAYESGVIGLSIVSIDGSMSRWLSREDAQALHDALGEVLAETADKSTTLRETS